MSEQCRATHPAIPGLRCERPLSWGRGPHEGWHRAETPDSPPEAPKVVSWP